ncbi:MAG: sulfotransferase family 2 domain-containing protein [Myxococcales bacterium]|nr:sulfotransferase family 2 domain-containing protein [Myxococcales bacterium]
MILSPDRKFVFVHIMKTAGESVEIAYDGVARWNDLLLGGSPHGERMAGPYAARFGLHKHSTAAEIREVVGADTWAGSTSYAIVRDPVSRMVSAWTYLQVVRNSITWRDRAKSWVGRGPPKVGWVQVIEQARTFSEWLNHPVARQSMLMQPQASFVTDASGAPIVTDILRFESLPSEWERVRGRLGLEGVPLPHKNSSGGVDKPVVTDADRVLIHELMAADYEMFGYARS